MKLTDIKRGGKFRQFVNGLTYKKRSVKQADLLDKEGKRLFGAVFSKNMVVYKAD